jgi:GntR family transcriptional regulator, carbon starvation induced regulator
MKFEKAGDWGEKDRAVHAGEFRSRTSETYARIRHDVIGGRLPPGSKLKIDQLRSLYDAGATPVREALSYLAADGFVIREDQKGFRVAQVSGSEFEELLRVRCLVEQRALHLAIERGGEEWESRIVVARHHLLGKPHVERAEDGWERHHKIFHMSLISACGSSLLLRLANQLYDENNRYRCIARLNGVNRDVHEEHEQIVQATLDRDSNRAVALLLEHYTRTGKLLRTALNEMTKATESDAA